MNSTLWVRRFLAIVVVLILGAANVVDMVGRCLLVVATGGQSAAGRC